MFSSYFMLWISTKFLGLRALQVGVFIAFLEGIIFVSKLKVVKNNLNLKPSFPHLQSAGIKGYIIYILLGMEFRIFHLLLTKDSTDKGKS